MKKVALFLMIVGLGRGAGGVRRPRRQRPATKERRRSEKDRVTGEIRGATTAHKRAADARGRKGRSAPNNLALA